MPLPSILKMMRCSGCHFLGMLRSLGRSSYPSKKYSLSTQELNCYFDKSEPALISTKDSHSKARTVEADGRLTTD